jgi:hypothetical protein
MLESLASKAAKSQSHFHRIIVGISGDHNTDFLTARSLVGRGGRRGGRPAAQTPKRNDFALHRFAFGLQLLLGRLEE